jgi:DNA-binding transcriptional LysR family regulator
LISYPKTLRWLCVIPWRNEPMVLVCARSSMFATRQVIRLEELDGARMVGFDPGLAIRQTIDRALAACGADVEMAMEFDNIETIKRAIEIDAGMGVLPRPTVDNEVATGRLVAVQIEPAMSRPLAIVHRRHRQLSEPMKQFIRALSDVPGAASANPRTENAGTDAMGRARQPAAETSQSS